MKHVSLVRPLYRQSSITILINDVIFPNVATMPVCC